MRYGYDMTAVSRTVINAYAYADYDIIAKIAAVLGETAVQHLPQPRREYRRRHQPAPPHQGGHLL